jgi:hypothetical protein
MPVIIDGTAGITYPSGTVQNTAYQNRFKNRIINGDMRIDQRNAGASVSATDNTYCLDRWYVQNYPSANGSKFSIQQNAGSVTPPVGFNTYLGITSSSAYTLSSTSIYNIAQYIEGFNFADLGWGTANAKTITLSFWVRSSLTGTFGGVFSNSAFNYCYPYTYTISSANTWEQKTITISGPTSGTWIGATNGVGARVLFNLGTGTTYSGTAGSWSSADYRAPTGATSVVGTSGATFYITGVQLEVGISASAFEYVDIGTQLTMCQRYYYRLKAATSYVNGGVGRAYSTTNGQAFVAMPVSMRAAPTASYSALSDWNSSGSGSITAMNPVSQYTADYRQMSIDITSPFSSGQTVALNANNTTNAWIDWSAEL